MMACLYYYKVWLMHMHLHMGEQAGLMHQAMLDYLPSSACSQTTSMGCTCLLRCNAAATAHIV